MALPLGSAPISPFIETEELARRIREKSAPRIIDVREPNEFHSGHIPGAENLPLSRFVAEFRKLPRDVEVVLVCRSGNRSGMAQQFLRQQGYHNTRNFIDGMLGWNGPIA